MNALSNTLSQTMRKVRGWLTPEQWAKAETVGEIVWSVARHSLIFILVLFSTFAAQLTGVAALAVYLRNAPLHSPEFNTAFGYAYLSITNGLAVGFCVVWWILAKAFSDNQAGDDDEP